MASMSPTVCQFCHFLAPLTVLVSVPESEGPLVVGEYRLKLGQIHCEVVAYGFEATMELSYFGQAQIDQGACCLQCALYL